MQERRSHLQERPRSSGATGAFLSELKQSQAQHVAIEPQSSKSQGSEGPEARDCIAAFPASLQGSDSRALELFDDNGAASMYSSDSDEDAETERLKSGSSALGTRAQRRLEAMLRALTPRRERIARCMALALDNAHAADRVAEIMTQSLLVPATPIPRKIARLYVVSDILYNSAADVRNAWYYRTAFETRLARVFAHLGAVTHTLPGRMKIESVQRQVLVVLECWDAWLVYPPSYTTILRELATCRRSAT